LPRVSGEINVAVDAKEVITRADLVLEDLSFRAKEWQLLLPPQAHLEALPPPGLKLEVIAPDGKNLYWTIRLPEPAGKRWQVKVEVRSKRPPAGGRLPIGPFLVLGAYQQQGTITVKMPSEASLGERLVYHYRPPETSLVNSSETEATFKYVAPALLDKALAMAAFKAPLELECRYEKNQLETRVEHVVKIKSIAHGWEIDTATKINVKAIYAGIGAIDLKLPLPQARWLPALGAAGPEAGFPAVFPWSGLTNPFHPFPANWTDPPREENLILDDMQNALQLVPQDPFGKTRAIWPQRPGKQEISLHMKSLVRLPPADRRFRLDLPRPINTQDRGCKITILADENIELLDGPWGVEEPVPEKHRFDLSSHQALAAVPLAWKPYRREVVAESVVDVTLFEHSAQVRQTIRFPWGQPAAGNQEPAALVAMDVPPGIDRVTAVAGGTMVNRFLRPDPPADFDKAEVTLQFDLPLKSRTVDEFAIPLVWPTTVSRKDVKVRVWSQLGGVKVQLPDALWRRGLWKERSVEGVAGKDSFPLLVLQASTSQPSLSLKLEEVPAAPLAALLADRGLIQVMVTDDGAQHVRARYLVRKINAPHLDIELPLALSRFRDRPTFRLGKFQLTDWRPVDAHERNVRVKLNPDLAGLPATLEIAYTIPPDAVERSSWRLALLPPVFRSEILIDQLHWQMSLPEPRIAAALGRNLRTEMQWGLRGWLWTPEAAPAAEPEGWPGPDAVCFAFSCTGSGEPYVVYHLKREWWLLGCSGIFLILTLGIYCSPLPRIVFGLSLLGMGVGALMLGLLCPALLPPILFGIQPGVALLALFVAIHWYWMERYRRQLVFLPAFSRTKPSSTMVRGSSAKRPREASTVDAPATPGSGPAPSPSGS
jgi:hypothetical protein